MTNIKLKTASKIILFLVILGIVIGLLWWLLRPHTTTESDVTESAKITSMTCTGGNVVNEVFDTSSATAVSYTLNLLFSDGILTQLTYQYEGTYESEEAAAAQLPYLHADYNLDLQDRGLTSTYFDGTTVGQVDNVLQVNFTADSETLTADVADYLLMDLDENGELPSTYDAVKANYVNRSFVCVDVVE